MRALRLLGTVECMTKFRPHRVIAWLEDYEKRHGEVRLGKLSGAPARKAIVFVLIMTVHSFGEGYVSLARSSICPTDTHSQSAVT